MLLLLLLCLARPVPASYRHLSLPALCRRQQPAARKAVRVVLEQGGAAVLSLRQDDTRLPYWRCDLELRAEPGFGLMAHLETASLRPDPVRRGHCQDYLQLGRDDNMPFFTWDKSPELCGDSAPGATFDVPNGQAGRSIAAQCVTSRPAAGVGPAGRPGGAGDQRPQPGDHLLPQGGRRLRPHQLPGLRRGRPLHQARLLLRRTGQLRGGREPG
jgi:hypothetical protein